LAVLYNTIDAQLFPHTGLAPDREHSL